MSKQKTDEFKEQAIKYRIDNSHLSVAEVCKNLGISVAAYYKWNRLSKTNQGSIITRGSGNYESDEAKEITRLKKELKAKDDALNILKKAISILGEEPK
ncbi:MAG: transposase [Acholeplasma sp.]|nr:transposase [Acholeplasma sp.]